jgi:hypothetical protein
LEHIGGQRLRRGRDKADGERGFRNIEKRESQKYKKYKTPTNLSCSNKIALFLHQQRQIPYKIDWFLPEMMKSYGCPGSTDPGSTVGEAYHSGMCELRWGLS